MIKTLIGDRLLLKQIELSDTTKGGIMLMSGQANTFIAGEVVLIGADCKRKFEVGDKIAHTYAGTPIVIDGEPFVILRETDIIGLL